MFVLLWLGVELEATLRGTVYVRLERLLDCSVIWFDELPIMTFETLITILRIQKFTLMMKEKQFYLKMCSNKLINL